MAVNLPSGVASGFFTTEVALSAGPRWDWNRPVGHVQGERRRRGLRGGIASAA